MMSIKGLGVFRRGLCMLLLCCVLLTLVVPAAEAWDVGDYIEPHSTRPPTIPRRRLTEAERNAWIAHYHTSGGINSHEREVLRLVNIERARVGARPVELCPAMFMAARFKSQSTVDLRYFSHTNPVYGLPWTMASQLFGVSVSAENLSGRNDRREAPASVVARWMNSSGHRANMLDPRWRTIGVGWVDGTQPFSVNVGGFPFMLIGTTVQLFGVNAPRPAPLPTPTAGTPFIDIAGHWGVDAIRFVYQRRLMSGTTHNTFAPNATLTRGMMVTILWRMAGQPNVVYRPVFRDVAPGRWYTNAVLWAFDAGIAQGTGNTFAPGSNITREQMAVMLHGYARHRGQNVIVPPTFNPRQFTDHGRVSPWAQEAMFWAVHNNLIGGVTPTTLVPQGTANRAQCATILMRYVQRFGT